MSPNFILKSRVSLLIWDVMFLVIRLKDMFAHHPHCLLNPKPQELGFRKCV